MGWLVALPTLAALYVFNKRVNPKGRAQNIVSVMTLALALGVGVGLAYTWVGRLIAGAVGLFQKMSGDQNTQAGIAIGITVLALLIVVADVAFDKVADKPAQFSAILLPTLLALVVGGSLGKTGGDAVETTKTQMATMWSNAGQ